MDNKEHSSYTHGIIVILIILLISAILVSIYFYNKSKDLQDTVNIKNNRIQELLNTVHEQDYGLYTCKMARDETYELFMSCVYPDGRPYEEE